MRDSSAQVSTIVLRNQIVKNLFFDSKTIKVQCSTFMIEKKIQKTEMFNFEKSKPMLEQNYSWLESDLHFILYLIKAAPRGLANSRLLSCSSNFAQCH